MRYGALLAVMLSACTGFTHLEMKGFPSAKDHPDAKYVVLLDETSAR